MSIDSVHTFMKQTSFMEYMKKRKGLKKASDSSVSSQILCEKGFRLMDSFFYFFSFHQNVQSIKNAV